MSDESVELYHHLAQMVVQQGRYDNTTYQTRSEAPPTESRDTLMLQQAQCRSEFSIKEETSTFPHTSQFYW
jgi:hypothetical protein